MADSTMSGVTHNTRRSYYDSEAKAVTAAMLCDALQRLLAGGKDAPDAEELEGAIHFTKHTLRRLEDWQKDRGEA